MTDEELQRIRERVNFQQALVFPQEVFQDRANLLTEVERLREIVQAVATFDNDVLPAYGDSGPPFCVFGCSGMTDRPWTGSHTADCPVTKARAILAQS